MSVTVDSADRGGPLSAFLANSPAAAPTGNSELSQFSSALEQSLIDMGYDPEQITVSVDSPSEGTPGGGEHTLTITLGSPVPTSSAAMSAAGTSPAVNEGSEEGEPSAPVAPEASTASSPAYDPQLGPQISQAMWTEEMLTGDLTNDLLKNIKNPSEFLQARLERARTPTEAVMVDVNNGGISPTNPSFLATKAQAEELRQHLLDLGLDVGEVRELSMGGGQFEMDWGTEDRRVFAIDGHSVGLILEQYARSPVEVADQKMIEQFQVA